MDPKTYLKEYASRADAFLDTFFDKKTSEVGDIGKPGKGILMAVDMLKRYKAFSKGGKKLRGALIQLGYELGGGKKEDVLAASTSIEVIHSFLLMHDDIQDQDVVRRGFPTVHKQYETRHLDFKTNRDSAHYGLSMGINTGDLGAYLGMELMLDSEIEESRKVKAGVYFTRLLQRVAFGQGLDVTYEQLEDISEEDVLQVHLHKTGIYTIGGPLKLGALLAGMDEKNIDALEKFGEPVGIAFQLRDDELGLFSTEEELGKPVGGDVREGKNTILKIKASEFSEGKDREFLKWAYGNKDINEKDIEKVRELTISSGALKYSQELSVKLVEQGKGYIKMITDNKNQQNLLVEIADFVISRQS